MLCHFFSVFMARRNIDDTEKMKTRRIMENVIHFFFLSVSAVGWHFILI